jgi:hypothetical protein
LRAPYFYPDRALRAPRPDPQRVLIVGRRNALLCREDWDIAAGNLMDFAAISNSGRGHYF